MDDEKDLNIDNNDDINKNEFSVKISKFLILIKEKFLNVIDIVKNKSKKVLDEVKSNISKTTEEKMADAENKLKSKLEENEKKIKMKIESEERIRQMKREAEERKKQEKIEAEERIRREKEEERLRIEKEKEEEKLRIKREQEDERIKRENERIRQENEKARLEKEKEEQLEKERIRRENERKEKERIRELNREKRKPLIRTIIVLLILSVVGFVGFKVYQLVSFEKETERQKQLKMIEMDKQKEIAEIEKQKQKELAEIEARKQIEIASITEAEKKKRHNKDGFNIDTNELISIRLFDFSVPNYWTENKSKKNSYDGLAEIGGKIAELQISSLEDNEPVSFDILKKETLNGNMQKVFVQEGWFEGAKFVDYKKVSTNVIDGYVYTYTCPYKDTDTVIKILCFSSIEDNRWYYVALQESINTSFSYITDYNKMIEGIVRNHNIITKE